MAAELLQHMYGSIQRLFDYLLYQSCCSHSSTKELLLYTLRHRQLRQKSFIAFIPERCYYCCSARSCTAWGTSWGRSLCCSDGPRRNTNRRQSGGLLGQPGKWFGQIIRQQWDQIGDFWKIFAKKFLTKVVWILDGFLVHFEKQQILSKNCSDYFLGNFCKHLGNIWSQELRNT